MRSRVSSVVAFVPVAAFGLFVSACSGCSKETPPDPTATAATAAPSAAPTVAAAATAVPVVAAAAASNVPVKIGSVAPKAGDGGAADSGPALAVAAAPAADAAAPPAAAGKSGYADEIPKPCTDGMGRLGLMTFTDLGGGKVKIGTAKNSSAACTRQAATQYSCDWIVEGTPTGTFVAKFDPAKKSVSGSIAKGKMFTCPPSSQR